MSVLPNRRIALRGLERVSADVSSLDLHLPDSFTSSQKEPFLSGVIICGTGFSKGIVPWCQICIFFPTFFHILCKITVRNTGLPIDV
jgi:hypothetical protein